MLRRQQHTVSALAFLPGLLILAGDFLPVADFSPVGGGPLTLGFRGDGRIFLILGATLLLAPVLLRRRPWLLIVAAATTAFVGFDFIHFFNLAQNYHLFNLGLAWPLLFMGCTLALIAGIRYS